MLGNEGQEEGWCRAACGACKAPEPLPHGLSGAWRGEAFAVWLTCCLKAWLLVPAGLACKAAPRVFVRCTASGIAATPLPLQIRMRRKWTGFSSAC